MSPLPPNEGFRYACFAAENGHLNVEAGGERSKDETGVSSSVCAGPRVHVPPLSPALVSSPWLDGSGWTEKEKKRLRRCVKAAVKGFSIGAGLKGGLALFAILSRLRSRRSTGSPRKPGSITNSEAILAALKDTLRYGLFLGTFAGTFVSLDELIAALWGQKRWVL
ncbi:hypothetical protein Taro_034022 [Colocasia esculenta]|uniref:Uncharacterized protein n=1 Tax=Colocasia esculenta TaxID=4460 RepID=A0A843W6D9_COLES|nr:hypothetical protein [Colocasia esculenta]